MTANNRFLEEPTGNLRKLFMEQTGKKLKISVHMETLTTYRH